MFDLGRLDDIVRSQEEIVNVLNEPTVVNDQARFRKLMKEQTDLNPIVEKYLEYKEAKQGIEDSLMMLDGETDEELKELAKEELNECSVKLRN